jgi:hypothetical protein
MDGAAGRRQPPPFTDRSGRKAATIDWLLDGDPSIRWQVLADLTGAGQDEIDAERSRVAAQGWGAQLLAAQSADGRWAQALYSPKWTSTTYTLLLLHWLGLPSGHPQALAGCRQVWDGASFYGGGLTIAKSLREPETCITAMLILLASSFGLDDDRLDPTVAWLLDQQLADGGWNCESIRSGSRHGSFHTSISTLEALLRYQQSGGMLPVSESMHRGRTFFLDHHLYRSHRTGEVASPAFTRFPFPPQWHFDVLRGLEHFRAAGATADPRLGEAIDVVRRARRSDGTWPLHRAHPGRTWFRMEQAGPSRWTTLRALRVLQWWGQDGQVADLQGSADHALSTEPGQDRRPFG